ncbi:hypothetical protein GCM10007940_01940 [Portibacter lacus]|uniref:Uncharacterized protein n=2 Tax=Portibacter lacus TaxID=1099794 RepID=A0AA37SM55_9BACT|nr:hypothetical protein GCM10007940_01940 [Portibacter lacus]
MPICNLSAQSIASEERSDLVKITGGFAINLGAYQSFGIESRRDPFSYLFAGNLNFNIKGVNIPVGASFSQQETRFLQPFNRYGLSPKYKWVQTHFGYRNMDFNPYTLNSHTFLGTGFDIDIPSNKGPKISVSAMYGRLRRAIEPAEASINGGLAAYKRNGYGFKVKLTNRTNAGTYFSTDMFKAKDILNSVETPLDLSLITPKENLTLGFRGQVNLLKNIYVNADLGVSALTRDQRAEVYTGNIPSLFSPFESLYSSNSSTQYTNAYQTGITYANKYYSVGVEFEHIDPGYETLGSYYFQNDLENITGQASTTLNNGKIRLNGSLGSQRNNLDSDKATRTNRIIGSFGYNHSISNRLSTNFNFSNYSSSVKVVYEELTDSVNLFQVNTNISAGANYLLNKNNSNQALIINAGYQVGNSRDEYRIFDNTTNFITLNVAHMWRIVTKDMSLNTNLSYANNETGNNSSTLVGPTVSLSKSLKSRGIKLSYAIGWKQNVLDGAASYQLLTNRFRLSYRLKKIGSLGAELYLLNKNDQGPQDRSFSELRARTSYKYNF